MVMQGSTSDRGGGGGGGGGSFNLIFSKYNINKYDISSYSYSSIINYFDCSSEYAVSVSVINDV